MASFEGESVKIIDNFNGENFNLWKFKMEMVFVAPLLWPSVGVKPNTWKSWELESSMTPECSELDIKGKNNLHWDALGVVGKVLKRRYRKCPRIGN
jgi:hypothetical protein